MPFFFILFLVFNSLLQGMEQQEQQAKIIVAIENKQAPVENQNALRRLQNARIEKRLRCCGWAMVAAVLTTITYGIYASLNTPPQCIPNNDDSLFSNETTLDMQARSFDLKVTNCGSCSFQIPCLKPIAGVETLDELRAYMRVSLGAQCGRNASYSVRSNILYDRNPNNLLYKDNFRNFDDERSFIVCDSKRSHEKKGKQKQPKSRNFKKRSR